MGKPTRTVTQKLQTKLKNLKIDANVQESRGQLKVKGHILVNYTKTLIKYGKKRYYPQKIEDIALDHFTVNIPLSHENLVLLNASLINPPFGARKIIDSFKSYTDVDYDHITIGAAVNKIEGKSIFITKEVYDNILSIDKEEGKTKRERVEERVSPFMKAIFNITLPKVTSTRNLSLLLSEIIASGELTQQDLTKLSSQIQSGANNQVVIEKQVNKQVEWLIDSIETILEETELTSSKAKDFGHDLFGFSKSEVSGPEHLMELILSKYGQYTLFGVPALLNTKKYVQHATLSRSQFDIILITHLGDIEVVELKRPDKIILDYDSSRGKFYPAKDLSIAISQAERYISAVQRDNDEDYKIDGKTIMQFVNAQVGDTLYVETVRPSAVIIIGSWQSLTKPHSSLTLETRNRVSKQDYDDNGLRAYRELKGAFRNIDILTYSELLEHARTRLELSKDKTTDAEDKN